MICVGIDTGAGTGDSQQDQGREKLKHPAELQVCLLPNRRVEFVFEAQRP